MLFLAPLLLPVTTRAGGGFDQWVHDFFRHDDHRAVRPLPPGYGYDRGNPYRQFDPNHAGNGHPGSPLGDPSAGNSVPLDGGLVLLAAAGLMLGVMKVYGQRRKMVELPVR